MNRGEHHVKNIANPASPVKMTGEEKLTAPKFSSFKSTGRELEKAEQDGKKITVPKFGSSSKRITGSSNSRRSEHSDNRKGESASHKVRVTAAAVDSHQRRHKQPHNHARTPKVTGSPSESPNRHRLAVVHRQAKSALQDAPANPYYFFDTKGDHLITRYGGIDKSEIPAYYRSGYGRVMGTAGRLIMHREGARDQFSIIMPGEGNWTSRDKSGLRSKIAWAKQPSFRVRAQPAPGNAEDFEDLTFIPVEDKVGSKRGKDEAVSSSEDDERPDYRSIRGKAKARSYGSDGAESVDNIVQLDISTADSNPLKWKSIQLGKQVRDHPEDIDAWLELADHQDALLRAGEMPDEIAAENAALSFAEIKVSLLESALSNVIRPTDRSRILVKLMVQGGKVWTSKKLASKWKDIESDEEHSFTLWITHLNSTMSNISTFRYQEVKQMILQRLHKETSPQAAETSLERIRDAIYIFLRGTRFMYDAGYMELAVAAWQALLEYNLFRPADQDSNLEAFRDFWENEAPRIGDQDAQGWRSYLGQIDVLGKSQGPALAGSEKATPLRDSYKAWGYLETFRAKMAQLPARTMDEGNDEDPFRVVMFSDIEEWLFIIPDDKLPRVMEQLVDAFLAFFALPPAFLSDEWTVAASHDQFVINAQLNIERYAQGNEPTTVAAPILPGVQCAQVSLKQLFGDRSWFQAIQSERKDLAVTSALVLRALKQLVHTKGVETLGTYYLAFCSHVDPHNIKKAAKVLLKQYPSNASLYQAYALAECAAGHEEVSEKVLASAIGMFSVGPRPRMLTFEMV